MVQDKPGEPRLSKKRLTARYHAVHSIVMATTSRPATRAPATTDSDKWEIQFRKGCLELAILAALSSGRLYGLEILRRLEESSNLIVSEGTIYPLLSRLKSEGVLDSEWVESEAGHPRKYYRLTPAGRRRAAGMARMWSEFSSNLANLVSPLLRETR
jgi:PadR family transcriptional regulator